VYNVDLTDVGEIAEAATEMYIFAERYGIEELKGDAMARLEWCWGLATELKTKEGAEEMKNDTVNGCEFDFDFDFDFDDSSDSATFVSPETIRRAYEYTEPGSVVREWLVAAFERFCCFDRAAVEELPTRYLQDVLEKYRILDIISNHGDEDWMEAQEDLALEGRVLQERGSGKVAAAKGAMDGCFSQERAKLAAAKESLNACFLQERGSEEEENLAIDTHFVHDHNNKEAEGKNEDQIGSKSRSRRVAVMTTEHLVRFKSEQLDVLQKYFPINNLSKFLENRENRE
jgi:hypothetical protein